MSEKRLEMLGNWLRDHVSLKEFELSIVAGDASFRRYFRVSQSDKTYIAMDAPPEHEDCRPFIAVARAFADVGLHVPQIVAEDLEQGFLLLSDLGDVQYADVLNADTVEQLYGDALDALLRLQSGGKTQIDLPPYDYALLMREMDLFPDWFLGKHLGVTLDDEQQLVLEQICELLAQTALAQTQVWVHRDYHSRNLMQVADNNPGVLDFQDAVVGAVTYDLVSLLRDCYVAWPREQVYAWAEAYRQRLIGAGVLDSSVDQPTFQRWFDYMGVQRHMKAIGIFARLNHRDGKPGYLDDIPRTLSYVLQVTQDYPDLRPLNFLIQETVLTRYSLQTGKLL